MGQQTKIMTKEWNQMDPKKKQKYTDLAEKDKIRYQKEKEIYLKKKMGV